MSKTREHARAVEALNQAKAKLAHAQEHGSRAQHAAQMAAGVSPGDFHPACDTRAKMVAEAELAVALANAECDRLCVDGNGLRASLAAAIKDLAAKLEAIVDPPTPTLDSTPEAKAEYERATAARDEQIKANASERAHVVAEGYRAFAAKVQPDGSDFISRAETAITAIKAKLAQVTDPEPPVLGDATVPAVIQGLQRATEAHKATLRANDQKRQDAREAFELVAGAIETGCQSLGKRRREAGLPSFELFQKEPQFNPGYPNHLSYLLRVDPTPFALKRALQALGGDIAPNDAGPRAVLRNCEKRAAAYADWQQQKAEWDAKPKTPGLANGSAPKLKLPLESY